MLRLTLVLAALAIGTSALWQSGAAPSALEQSPLKHGPMALRTLPKQPAFRWADQPSEAAYRVAGTVSYMICEGEDWRREDVRLAVRLPRNRTYYRWPAPEGRGEKHIKDIDVRVEALASDGAVLEQSGFSIIAEPRCGMES
jgi:hypothetical protein